MQHVRRLFLLVLALTAAIPAVHSQRLTIGTAAHKHQVRDAVRTQADIEWPPSFLDPFVHDAGIGSIDVDITSGHAVNSLIPYRTLGAGVDNVPAGSVPLIYTPDNIAQMLMAGHGPLTYRLYTELSVQNWHWNPVGTYSDPAGQGYFTGDPNSSGQITDSYGYRLPSRGFTHDQGNDDDYSRLDDGDYTSYWKSNPYLSSYYTGEADTLHPQWIVIKLPSSQPIDAIRLDWANPYATAYQVQYWRGDDAINDPGNGQWITFPQGNISNATGGDVTFRLASSPIKAQFVRVLMTASSGTYDSHGTGDIRNSLGYALFEVGLGTLNGGNFTDLVQHRKNNSQTITYCSSVDPWNQPSNQVTDAEQPGLDIVYTCGLTRGLPAVIPVPVLYSTPDNAATEITYLENHGYAIGYVEMGEECDEQYMLPEDYGALYLQFATALHNVDPNLKLGGPVFAADNLVQAWADSNGNTDWLNRFVNYLKAHNRLSDLSFVSIEHYPFNPCNTSWSTLLKEPSNIATIFSAFETAGLSPGFPFFITETNFSYGYSPAPLETLGALWHADFIGSFLSGGGSGVYLYQYEPLPLFGSGNCWGSFSMFTATNQDKIEEPTAEFFSSQMIEQQWAQPVDAVHDIYPVMSTVKNGGGNALVTAYAMHRPDGQWSLMLINKDHHKTHQVTVTFHDSSDHYFTNQATMVTFGDGQYQWHPKGKKGYPNPDGPIDSQSVSGGVGTVYTLPAGSIIVLRGTIQ